MIRNFFRICYLLFLIARPILIKKKLRRGVEEMYFFNSTFPKIANYVNMFVKRFMHLWKLPNVLFRMSKSREELELGREVSEGGCFKQLSS